MRIALVTDAYIPSRTSAAVQMRDLALELARQGHSPTVLVPESSLAREWELTSEGPVTVLRLKAPRTKDIGNLRRAASEFLLPYYMSRGLSRSPLSETRWDGVVWYSPSIFLGPLVTRLKSVSSCRSYLVLRDLFPDWALDTGVMKKGLAYLLLKLVQRYQFSVADVIGVQTAGNLGRLAHWAQRPGKRLEVLNNWLAPVPHRGGSPPFHTGVLTGRKILVYAGNMGAAQDMGAILRLAAKMRDRKEVGFLFVGRGTEVPVLRKEAALLGLTNVAFLDEVDPLLVPALLAECHVGIVALDPRHTTHNIPGKFLTYMQAGLPVLARINPGNDLEALINGERVGRVYSGASVEEFEKVASDLLGDEKEFPGMASRARELASRVFSVQNATAQVLDGLDLDRRGR